VGGFLRLLEIAGPQQSECEGEQRGLHPGREEHLGSSASLSQLVTETPSAILAGCKLHGFNLSRANLTDGNLTGPT
jgi:hypothetical protein